MAQLQSTTFADAATVSSTSYNTSLFTGSGWGINYLATTKVGGSNASTGYQAVFDHLTVRGTMSIWEMLIQQIRATNGSIFVTSVGKVSAKEGTTNTAGVFSINATSGFATWNGSAWPAQDGATTFATYYLSSMVQTCLVFEGDYCTFAVGDVILMKKIVPVSNSSWTTLFAVGTVAVLGALRVAMVQFTNYSVGFTFGDLRGAEFVRIGNTGTTRNGSLYMTSDDNNAPFLDVVDGVKAWSGGAAGTNWGDFAVVKARLGRLDGIVSPTLGQLQGYGLYTQNAYLENNANIIGNLSVGDGKFYAGQISRNMYTYSQWMTTGGAGGPWINDTGSGSSTVTDTDNPFNIMLTKQRLNVDGYRDFYQYCSWGGAYTGKVTVSYWAKYSGGSANTRDLRAFIYYNNAHTNHNTTYTPTTTWTRYSWTFDVVNLGSLTISGLLSFGNGNLDVIGFQLELGPLSPYQPTDGTITLPCGPELMTNSGAYQFETDWTSPTNGLAAGWANWYNGSITASIVTGNGFNVNAQRVVNANAQTYFGVVSATTLTIGKTYTVSLKYRSNGIVYVQNSNSNTYLLLLTNTGNSVAASATFTAINDIYFVLRSDGGSAWFEVDEIMVREVLPRGYGMWTTAGGFGGSIQNPVVGISDYGMSIRGAGPATSLLASTIMIGNVVGAANYAIKLANTGTAGTSGLFGYTASGGESFALRLSGYNSIGGWNFTDTRLQDTNGNVAMDSSGRYFMSYVDANNYTKLYYDDANNWGILGVSGGLIKFQLGNYAGNGNKIAGWSFDEKVISNFTIPPSGSTYAQGLYMSTTNHGAGSFYNGGQKLRGFAVTWLNNGNAGHIVMGQLAASGNSLKGNYQGIQMMDYNGLEYFALSANPDTSGSLAIYNRIAGWAFDNTTLSNGSTYITSNMVGIDGTNRVMLGSYTGVFDGLRVRGASETIQVAVDSGNHAYIALHDGTRWNVQLGNLVPFSGTGYGLRIINSAGVEVFNVNSTGVTNIAGWNFDNTALFTGTKVTAPGFSSGTGSMTISPTTGISSANFYVDNAGNAAFKGDITGATGTFSGSMRMTVKGTLNANDIVQLINDGGVAKIMKFVDPTDGFDYSADTLIASAVGGFIAVQTLGTDKVILGTRGARSSVNLFVLTISGTSISVSTPIIVTSSVYNMIGDVSITQMATDSFIICYKDATTGYPCTAVGTVTGTSISIGAAYVLVSAASSNFNCVALDATRFAVGYLIPSTSRANVIIGSFSGTAITLGSPYVVPTVTTYISVCMVKTGTNTIVLHGGATGSTIYTVCMTITSYTISAIGTFNSISSAVTSYGSLVSQATGAFVIVWLNSGASTQANVTACLLSGTTITAGVSNYLQSTDIVNNISTTFISTNIVAVSWQTSASSFVRLITVGAGTTTWSSGAVAAFNNGTVKSSSMIISSTNKILLSYIDQNDRAISLIGAIVGTTITWYTAYPVSSMAIEGVTACVVGSGIAMIFHDIAIRTIKVCILTLSGGIWTIGTPTQLRTGVMNFGSLAVCAVDGTHVVIGISANNLHTLVCGSVASNIITIGTPVIVTQICSLTSYMSSKFAYTTLSATGAVSIVPGSVSGTTITCGGTTPVTTGGIPMYTGKNVEWIPQSVGLPADAVYDITQIGSILFTTLYSSGVYKSLDNGITWTLCSTFTGANCLTVSGTTLFAGTQSGIWMTTDLGINWTAMSMSGVTNSSITDIYGYGDALLITTAGSLPTGVYRTHAPWATYTSGLISLYTQKAFAFGGYMFMGGSSGNTCSMHRSSDNGRSWSRMDTNLPTSLSITAFAPIGTTLFIATSNQVYKTSDYGATWAVCTGTGLPTTQISAMIACGTNLICEPYNNDLYLSTNNGVSWTSIPTGITGSGIGWSFACIGTTILATSSVQAGVYRTTNNGANWSLITSGITTARITSLTSDGTYFYAASDQAGISRSTDDGLTWTTITSVANYVAMGSTSRLVVSGTKILFMNTTMGTWLSTDSGATYTYKGWLSLYDIGFSGSEVWGVGYGGYFVSTGVWTSTPGWTSIAGSMYTNYAFKIMMFNYMPIVGTNTYIAISNNGSWTGWYGSISGIGYNPTVNSMAVIGNNVFLADNAGKIWKSSDNCTTWVTASTGLPFNQVRSIAVSGTTLVAIGYLGSQFDALYTSTTDGTSWVLKSNNFAPNYSNRIRILGSNIYICTYMLLGAIGTGVQLAYNGLVVSTDSGTTFNMINTGLSCPYGVSAFVGDSSNMFLGFNNYGGVYRSTDNGQTWAPLNIANINSKLVYSLALSGTTLYVGTSSGVATCTSYGTGTWSQLSATGLGSNIHIRSLVVSGGYIFVGTSPFYGDTGNVFYSTDGGTTWNPANTTLSGADIYAMVISGSRLYAGTSIGLYYTINNGGTWTQLGAGTVNQSYSIAITPDGAGLYVGGPQGTIYISTNSGTSWTTKTMSSGSTGPAAAIAVLNDKIYVGAQASGSMQVSIDGGNTWTTANTGMVTSYVNAIILSDNKVIIGCTSFGAYASTCHYDITKASAPRVEAISSTKLVVTYVNSSQKNCVKTYAINSGTISTGLAEYNYDSSTVSGPMSFTTEAIGSNKIIVVYGTSTGFRCAILFVGISAVQVTNLDVVTTVPGYISVANIGKSRYMLNTTDSALVMKEYVLNGTAGTATIESSSSITLMSASAVNLYSIAFGNKVVSLYADTIGNGFIKSRFIVESQTLMGMANTSATDGQVIVIARLGAIVPSMSGMTPATRYYVGADSQPTTFDTIPRLIGVALTATDLLMTNNDS